MGFQLVAYVHNIQDRTQGYTVSALLRAQHISELLALSFLGWCP